MILVMTPAEIKLNVAGIARVKLMIKDISKTGRTEHCPQWSKHMTISAVEKLLWEHSLDICQICISNFPKILRPVVNPLNPLNRQGCPCYYYDADVTIKFLVDILSCNGVVYSE